MRRGRLELYVHLIWATWNRAPFITPEIERELFRQLSSTAQKRGCEVIALNGMEEHIHLLVSMPAQLSVSDLVKLLKGASSHFVNETLHPDYLFRWQGSYGAFTVSRWDVKNIRDYIHNQKQHHSDGTLVSRYELSDDDDAE